MDAQPERRQHRRLDLRLPLQIYGTLKSGEEFYRLTETVNISTGGAYFYSLHQFEVGMSIGIVVGIPYSMFDLYPFAELQGTATVVRVEDILEEETGIPVRKGVAVTFGELKVVAT